MLEIFQTLISELHSLLVLLAFQNGIANVMFLANLNGCRKKKLGFRYTMINKKK